MSNKNRKTDKKSENSQPKRTILDYFSQSSTTNEKRLKTERIIVESSLDSSLNSVISSFDIDNVESIDENNSNTQNLSNTNCNDQHLTKTDNNHDLSNISTNNLTNIDNNLNNIHSSNIIINTDNNLSNINTNISANINCNLSKIMAEYLDADISEFKINNSNINQESDKNVEKYEFLLNIKDKNGIRKGDNGYDPTSLYIPQKYYSKFTPFEKQFWDIKKDHFDTVIFFKKGKFYELYEDDAVIASKLFDLKVTDRVNMKMAGVPESSFENWAAKFIKNGYKIGRVDQTETSIGKKIREQSGKKDKIIDRKLKEIITCGTAYSPECVDGCFPFYIATLIQHSKCNIEKCMGPTHFSILLYDAGSNKLYSSTFCDSYDCSQLKTIFVQNDIKELITSEKIILNKNIKIHLPIKTAIVTSRKYDFQNDEEYECFVYFYNFMKLLNREKTVESAILSNIKESGEFMSLDGSTLVNLDILNNNFDFSENFSLFKSINYCSTAFGERLLRKWIVTPLKSVEMIYERRKIANLFSKVDCNELIQLLKETGDIERYYGRLSGCNPSFKDIKSFVDGFKSVKSILKLLNNIFNNNTDHNNIKDICINSEKYLKSIISIIDQFENSYLISDSDITPGNENDELFVLNKELIQIQNKLQNYINIVKDTTGISDLSYKSIGKEIFQIETSANNQMPVGFYLVSSTKSLKRYYSNELKIIVNEFDECEEKIFQSKGSILRRAVEYIKTFSFDIHQIINYLSGIDCLLSFSIFNRKMLGTEPEFGNILELIDFTNPIYPDYIKNTYVPKNNITLITGPNMGGKSTFLRSICLNIILAQMGMNVMCKSMKLPVYDKIFTRIGASDSLAKGESTFMMEMNEASKILNQSTKDSFVIMDELGRGTSTRDGAAISHAVLDYIRDIKCHCLFSTHYHQLVEEYEYADKAYVKCKLDENDIIFLYKIEEGVCGDSYGLYVAKMAGIPEEIIDKAQEMKRQLLRSKQ